jgi:hypothetical protein
MVSRYGGVVDQNVYGDHFSQNARDAPRARLIVGDIDGTGMEFPPFGLHPGKPCIDAGMARGVRDDHLIARVVQLDTDSFADSTGSARDKRELLRHALYLI